MGFGEFYYRNKNNKPPKLLQFRGFTLKLYRTLGYHGVGNFYKSSNVRSINIVNETVLFGAVLTASFVNVLHDVM